MIQNKLEFKYYVGAPSCLIQNRRRKHCRTHECPWNFFHFLSRTHAHTIL